MESLDLALILAFDGSASVTYDEFGLMTRGCAAALRDPAVAAGLLLGPARASVCAVLLWSGRYQQEVLLDWTRLGSTADLSTFAGAIEDMPRAVPAGTTAIGSALLASEALLDTCPSPTRRRVIDVVGDGRSNDGPPPAVVRDRLVEAGVVINGLCVLHEEPDLVDTYTREVIGGAGSFALFCGDYEGFAAAMQQKLVREVAAGVRARPVPPEYAGRGVPAPARPPRPAA